MGLRTQIQLDTIQGLLNQLTSLQIYGTGIFSGFIIGLIVGVIIKTM